MFDTDIDFDALVKGIDIAEIDIPVRLPEKITTLEQQWENSTADFPVHEFQHDRSRLLAAEQKMRAQKQLGRKIVALKKVEQLCEEIGNKYRDFFQLEDICAIGEYENSVKAESHVWMSVFKAKEERKNAASSIDVVKSFYQYLDRLLRIIEEFSTHLNQAFYVVIKRRSLEWIENPTIQERVQKPQWKPFEEGSLEFYLRAIDSTAKAILWAIDGVEANRKWDEQLERDASEGKLDKLVQAAIADAEAGDSWEI